ncbi:MAG: hypothetical protein JRD93_04235 [Deltaproteobacteria bacterium]|nr:hypothetical protein [Deltaproteobacteria bacterium]MBW2661201.1 hypothetical protein [Deltaproteobacteria bacterium]
MQKLKQGFLKAILFSVSFFIVTSLLFACKSSVPVRETVAPPSINGKLLILPFKDMSAIYGENVSLRCPLCGNVFLTGEVAEGADTVLTNRLISLISDRNDVELIPQDKAHGVRSKLLFGDRGSLSELGLIVETGKALGADAVLAGYVYRFRERIGTRYAADLPASVAFDVHLVDAANGRIMWIGHLDETQQPLSENLLKLGAFIKRKGAWITAEDIASSGLEEILKKFPAITGH